MMPRCPPPESPRPRVHHPAPDCHTPLTPEAPVHTPLCSSRHWEQDSFLQPLPFLSPHPSRRELDLGVRSPDGATFISGWVLGKSNPTLGRVPHLAEAFLFLCLRICALPLLPSHPCCRGGWLSVAQARCCRLLPLWKVICMTLLLQACPTLGLALEGEVSLGLKLTWVRVLGTGSRAEAQPITQCPAFPVIQLSQTVRGRVSGGETGVLPGSLCLIHSVTPHSILISNGLSPSNPIPFLCFPCKWFIKDF